MTKAVDSLLKYQWNTVLSVYISAYVLLLLVVGVINSYLGLVFTEQFSFHVADGWCNPVSEGLYGHCFGDFGVKFAESVADNAYVPESVSPANPPAVLALFKGMISAGLTYNQGLILWLGSIVLSALALGLVTARFSRDWQTRIMLFSVIGIGNVGVITSLDRGNPIPWIATGFVAAVVLSQKSKKMEVISALLLGLVGLLKWWSPVLFMFFLIQKKWIALGVSLSLWVSLQTISLMAATGGVINAVKQHHAWLTNSDYGINQLTASHSIYSLAQRLACSVTSEPEVCFETKTNWSIFFGISLIAVFSVLAFLWRRNYFLSAVPFALLPIIALPAAMVYNLTLLAAAVSLIFISSVGRELKSPKKVERSLVWLILSGSLVGMLVVPAKWFGSIASSILVPAWFSVVTLLAVAVIASAVREFEDGKIFGERVVRLGLRPESNLNHKP